MTAGGLVPSQTYKDLAARADNTAVFFDDDCACVDEPKGSRKETRQIETAVSSSSSV